MSNWSNCAIFVAAKLQFMIEIILLSTLIIAIAIAFMSVRVYARKGGSFRSQHIHDSRAMRERGIGCVLEQDAQARRRRTARSKRKTNIQR